MSEILRERMASHNEVPLSSLNKESRAPLRAAVEHIADTAEHGDPLDVMRRWRLAGSTALAGASITSFYGGYLTASSIDHLVLLGTIGLPTLAASSIGYKMAQSRRWTESRDRLDKQETDSRRLQIGDLEYYRGKNQMFVRWYAPEKDVPVDQVLSTLQGLTYGASKRLQKPVEALVPETFVTQLDDDFSRPTKTQDEWLEKIKGLDIEDSAYGKDRLVAVSPSDLLELRKKLQTSEITSDPIPTLIQLLKQHRPNHPLVKLERAWQTAPEAARPLLMQRLKPRLERNLNDSDRVITEDPDDSRIRYAQKEHVIGTIDTTTKAGHIRWRQASSGRLLEATPLAKHYDDVLIKLENAASHRDSTSTKEMVSLCESAAFISLHDPKFAEAVSARLRSIVNPQVPGNNTPTLQRRILDQQVGVKYTRPIRHITRMNDGNLKVHPYRNTHFIKRFMAAAGVIAALSIAGTDAARLANEAYDHDVKTAIAKTEGNAKDCYVSACHAELNKLVNNSPYLQATNVLTSSGNDIINAGGTLATRFALFLDRTPPSEKISTSQPNDKQSSNNNAIDAPASVGNVSPSEPNRSEWFINSSGGMSSEGYWSEATYNLLVGPGVDWDNTPADLPQSEAYSLQETITQLPNTPPTADRKLLSVEGAAKANILAGDFAPVITVPVLDGTTIVAAQIESNTTQKVEVDTNDDGQEQLLLPGVTNPENVTVRYWLGTDGTSIRDAEPGLLDLGGIGMSYPSVLRQDEQELTRLWYAYDKELPANAAARVVAEKAYIQSHFEYSLDPIPSGDDEILNNVETFAENVLNVGEANCNVANSLLAISNMSELNYVTGYYEGTPATNGESVLASHDAHAWTIDRQGNIVDATPIHLSAAAMRFFDQKPAGERPGAEHQQQRHTGLELVEGAGLLLLLGGAVFKRRQLLSLGEKAINQVALFELDFVPEAKLEQATSVINFVQYGPKGKTYEPMPIAPYQLNRYEHIKVLRELPLTGKMAFNDPSLRRRYRQARRLQRLAHRVAFNY